MSGILNVWDEASQSYKAMPALVGRGIKRFGYDVTKDKWVVEFSDGTSETIKGPTLEGGIPLLPTENWLFTLEDGSVVEKAVFVG